MELMKLEIEEEEEKTIIFRTYNNRTRKADWMLEKIIETALKPI